MKRSVTIRFSNLKNTENNKINLPSGLIIVNLYESLLLQIEKRKKELKYIV